MRPITALFSIFCLSACASTTTVPSAPLAIEPGFVRSDEARQKQAILDAEAILEGMAQARTRAERLARTARQPAQ